MPTSITTGARLQHIRGDELGLSDRGDDDVRLAREVRQISRAAVADGDGRIGSGPTLHH